MTIYGFGEVLLRFTPPNYVQLKDAHQLDINVGGAELNTLSTLAQFGHSTEMITTLPEHALGQHVRQQMYRTRVGTQWVQQTTGRLGTYYMEEGFGHRSGQVIYDRAYSTFAQQTSHLLDKVAGAKGDYFIFTGITLAVNHYVREHIVSYLQQLKQQGVTIVFDINFRSNLWTLEEAVPVIKSVLPLVDILFFGKKDATHLLQKNAESDDMRTCAQTIQQQFNIPFLASSNRSITESTLQGIALTADDYIESTAYSYTVLNRIGAGDAFLAGVIHGLEAQWSLAATLDFATKCSVLQHTTPEDALHLAEADILNLPEHFGELKR